MQATTGCKINVSPAAGQDFEREIGLVGSRDSIERAKNAIMEKVHAVVSTFPSSHLSPSSIDLLTLSYSKRRTTAAAAPQITKANTPPSQATPKPRSNISSRTVTNRTRNNSPLVVQAEERIPMQRMAAMRTMLLCGTLAIKPRIKASKIPKLKVPQARDSDT